MADEKTKSKKKGSGNMDELAKTIFAPIYPVIAENIIDRFKITKGVCLDLGSGPASLAIEVAKRTDLLIYAIDYSEDMHEAASGNIGEADLSERINLISGDVHILPFDDDYPDLIISRGSMFFWDDIHTAFKEIYRVLKPGGKTYIGGGFGNKDIFESVSAEMIRKNPEWKEFAEKNMSDENVLRFKTMLEDINVPEYEVINDDEGFWIVISKSEPGRLL